MPELWDPAHNLRSQVTNVSDAACMRPGPGLHHAVPESAA